MAKAWNILLCTLVWYTNNGRVLYVLW